MLLAAKVNNYRINHIAYFLLSNITCSIFPISHLCFAMLVESIMDKSVGGRNGMYICECLSTT